jgi:tripartite-type tricarboxylate transporter receptor subunit TctC
MDLAKNESDRAVLKLLSASTTIGRPIFTTPGVPQDRVKALRGAFDRMVRDAAFLDQATKENLEIDAVSGEEVQRIVAEIVATPKDIADRLTEIIGGIEQNIK